MEKYLSELLVNNCNAKDNLMNYEWARYESFKSYPTSSAASPLRLAKSGFFYTGNGVEVSCFCCGVKIQEWSEEGTVAETHQRLSPNCDLINGKHTSNVPIHVKQQNKDGAIDGPQDVQKGNYDHRRRYSTWQLQNTPRSSPNTEQNPELTDTTIENTFINNESSTLRYSYLKQASNYPPEQIERFPGITDERPKHPDYALKSERLSSFTKWTLLEITTPENLAESGFYYTGTKDSVKCFFCGGELRDWTLGDNPWIEHARWFPNCAYVKECRGVEFVNFCHTANIDYLPQSQTLELHGTSLTQTNVADDQSIKDLNSVSAKLVLSMGYTQDLVENAVKHTREHFNNTELKAQQLLDYLLDNSQAGILTDTQNSTIDDSVRPLEVPCSVQSAGMMSLDIVPENSAHAKQASEDEPNSLKEENRQLKEQMICKICMDKDANIVFLPCGHMVSCVECAHALRKCAVCRSVIQGTVRTYPA